MNLEMRDEMLVRGMRALAVSHTLGISRHTKFVIEPSKLEERGGSMDAIVAVTTDMSASYMPAVAENFPKHCEHNRQVHIKQALIKALDKV